MDITVRRGKSEDVFALEAIEKAAFDPARYAPTSRRQLRHALSSPASVILVAIATDDASAVGYAHLLTRRTSPLVRFYSLAVLPACQGGGVGSQLFAAAEHFAMESGYAGMLCEIRADNSVLLQRYNKLGYQLRHRLPDYYPDGQDGLKLLRLFSAT